MTQYSGQLYQLFSNRQLSVGSYVAINSPHDKYGVVLKSEIRPDGTIINLLRGIRKRHLEKVVYKF